MQLTAPCPEEIVFRAGWFDAAQLERLAQPMLKGGCGAYLRKLLVERAA